MLSGGVVALVLVPYQPYNLTLLLFTSSTLPPSSPRLAVNNHTVLSDFYTKSYHIVRKYSHTALVIFNELYPRVRTCLYCRQDQPDLCLCQPRRDPSSFPI